MYNKSIKKYKKKYIECIKIYKMCIIKSIIWYNKIKKQGFKMIDENKILAFIEKNDKRRGAKLDKHKELIKRLLGHNISKKEIYAFIKKEDDEIGSQINFYKYVSRNIETKLQPKSKNNVTPNQSPISKELGNKKTVTKEEKKEVKKEIPIAKSSKTSILKQDFNLMDYDEE